MHRLADARLLILPGSALLVGYLTLVPLSLLIYGSFRSGAVGEPGAVYTFANYARAYLEGSEGGVQPFFEDVTHAQDGGQSQQAAKQGQDGQQEKRPGHHPARLVGVVK